jgi:hypothetical protein
MLIHVHKDIIGPSSVHICPILPASAKALLLFFCFKLMARHTRPGHRLALHRFALYLIHVLLAGRLFVLPCPFLLLHSLFLGFMVVISFVLVEYGINRSLFLSDCSWQFFAPYHGGFAVFTAVSDAEPNHKTDMMHSEIENYPIWKGNRLYISFFLISFIFTVRVIPSWPSELNHSSLSPTFISLPMSMKLSSVLSWLPMLALDIQRWSIYIN